MELRRVDSPWILEKLLGEPFGVLGWAIGNSKGLGALGFVLGAFLGVVGLVIIALMGASDFPAYQARGPARPGRLAGPRRPLRPRHSGPPFAARSGPFPPEAGP